MRDWTVKDLHEWDEKICKIATEKYDLDWFPIGLEFLYGKSCLWARLLCGSSNRCSS